MMRFSSGLGRRLAAAQHRNALPGGRHLLWTVDANRVQVIRQCPRTGQVRRARHRRPEISSGRRSGGRARHDLSYHLLRFLQVQYLKDE
jgi:hypothetical protein